MEVVINKEYPHLGGNILGGDPNSWHPFVWMYLIYKFSPSSIFDMGCGEGHLMSYFHDKGINVYGSDGLLQNKKSSPNRIRDYMQIHDYNKGAMEPVPVDMTISCEFVEHIEAKYIKNIMPQFRSSKVVVFTHAVAGQDGYHHVNCQDDGYWIRLMILKGFRYEKTSTTLARVIAGDSHWKTILIFTL